MPLADSSAAVRLAESPGDSVTAAGDAITRATASGSTSIGIVSVAAPLVTTSDVVRTAGPVYALAVTRPLALTRATVVSSDAHVTLRPVSVVRSRDSSRAATVVVSSGKRLSASGVAVTQATACGGTVSVAVSATALLATMICAVRVLGPP